MRGSGRSVRGDHERFVRAFDWSKTPLGPQDVWPEALKALLGVMLGSSQPMFVAWGPERTLIYNSDYVSILGAKHPTALGRDLLDVWDEVRSNLTPIVERAYAGEPVHMDDIGFILQRNGYPEEAHFAFSYSPVRHADGVVAGFFCACTETTSQVLAERRAETERERMRKALQNMPGFVAMLAGPEHRFEYANKAFGEVVGRECVGRTVVEAFPDLATQEFFEILDRVYATGEPFVARGMPIRFAGEGREQYIDFLYHAIRDDAGRITGIFVGGYESTEMIRIAEDLRAERDRLAAVLDGMGEGFTLIAPDFRILDINTEGLRLDGRPKDQVVGRDHWEAHPGSERSEVGRLLQKAMAQRTPVSLEHRYIWPDGHASWLDMRAYPVRDGLAVFYRDVTDRKAIEEEAHAASERLDLALDAGAIAGTWVWNVAEDVFVGDERFARTFGMAADQLAAGLPISSVAQSIHPEDWPGVSEALKSVLRTGGRYRKEYRVKDGDRYRWIEASGQVEVDSSGAAVRFPGVLIGVEERKRAEEERDRAAALLRTFMEAVPGVVYAKDRSGRMLVANRGTAELVGKPLEEILGRTDAEFLLDKAAAVAIRETDSRIVAGGESVQVEEPIRKPDGTKTIWLSTKAPFRDANGEIIGLIGSSVDVTERKRVEALRLALIMLADRFRDLGDPDDIAYAAAEIVGRTLLADRTGYGKFDLLTDSVLVDRDWSASNAPSLDGVVPLRKYGAFVEDLKLGKTVVINDTIEDERTSAFGAALGSVAVGSLINVPIMESGGMAALLFVNAASARVWTADEVVFVRDVAERTRTAVERRRAELDLRRLAASLESQVAERTAERDRIWSNSLDLLTVVGLDGIVRAASPAWKQVLGYDPTNVVGRSFLLFVPEEEVEANSEAFERTRRGERLAGVETRCRHADGSTRVISWHTAVEDGMIFGYGRDITEERRQQQALRNAEEALRQSQKMEAVGQLTGGIAHDFNNMLAVVIGSLDLLKRRIGAADARTKRYVEAATDGARRAATLTQRLLAFSRQQPLSPEPLDLNRLVRGMGDLLRHSLGADIRLETTFANGLWRVHADANQLENVILNLAVNARDAMPDGGQLAIETRNAPSKGVRSDGLPPVDYVVLLMRDTGAGMPRDVLAKAFDPFFTTKEVGKGTGLGLSQVYGFINQSGGTVRLDSEPGCGTMVRIYLPRHDGEVEQSQGAPEDAEPSRVDQGELVLVVDDEPAVRGFSVDALTELGYRVVDADGAEAALKVLDANPDVHLLFTDIVMPDLNGRKLAEEARQRRPDLKVLFTTGYTRDSLSRHGAAEQGTELLGKPFTIEELAAKVRSVLDH